MQNQRGHRRNRGVIAPNIYTNTRQRSLPE
jgi:hypothetical protein